MAVAVHESMKTVNRIEGGKWEREIRSATQPVLAHFHTSWCDPCQILSATLEELAVELEGELQAVAVDLDHCPELARRYGITDVPTLILFDSGAPIASLDPRGSPRLLKVRLQGLLADYTTPARG